jgi:hypothetical protein
LDCCDFLRGNPTVILAGTKANSHQLTQQKGQRNAGRFYRITSVNATVIRVIRGLTPPALAR